MSDRPQMCLQLSCALSPPKAAPKSKPSAAGSILKGGATEKTSFARRAKRVIRSPRRRCHAAARSRPGRFRCDSGWSPGRPAALRSPSLCSKLPCSRPPRFFLSRCGLGARPGRQLLRLRADPVRPLAVPGLCPSAPESVSPVRLPSALLLISPRPRRTAPASPVRSGRR